MAITKKGVGWELVQSWYIALTLIPFNGTSFLAFFYVWLRGKKFTWLVAGLIHLASISILIWAANKYPDNKARPEWFDYTMWQALGLWLISIVHAVLLRKEFLLRIEASSEKERDDDSALRTKIQKQYGVSKNPVNDVLSEYSNDDISVRVCRTMLNNLPFAPNFDFYRDVEGAVRRLFPDAPAASIQQAATLAERDAGILHAVKTGIAVDRADAGLGIYTGIKNSMDAIKNKDRQRTFEADPQQAVDAGVKALALAYVIASLYEGSPADRVKAFLSTKAGQEAVIFYAAVEVALPFADNLVEASGQWMSGLLASREGEVEKRFAGFAEGQALEQAKGVLATLTQSIDGILNQTRMHLGPFMEKAQAALPSMLNVADSVTGGVATGLDMLPIWKLLMARCAAEACAVRTSTSGLQP